jgi:hypothetical protein
VNKYDETFDAKAYVTSLCENTKISIPDQVSIQFLSGWKSILEILVQSIKNYPISLIHINDSYSILDIEFAIVKQTKEVHIWRAINHARNESKTTCAFCGAYKNRLSRNRTPNMFCKECVKDIAVVGKTGTWIDKY